MNVTVGEQFRTPKTLASSIVMHGIGNKHQRTCPFQKPERRLTVSSHDDRTPLAVVECEVFDAQARCASAETVSQAQLVRESPATVPRLVCTFSVRHYTFGVVSWRWKNNVSAVTAFERIATGYTVLGGGEDRCTRTRSEKKSPTWPRKRSGYYER